MKYKYKTIYDYLKSNFKSQITNHKLRITNYESRITLSALEATTGRELRITNYKSLITIFFTTELPFSSITLKR